MVDNLSRVHIRKYLNLPHPGKENSFDVDAFLKKYAAAPLNWNELIACAATHCPTDDYQTAAKLLRGLAAACGLIERILSGYNVCFIGLRRAGFSREVLSCLPLMIREHILRGVKRDPEALDACRGLAGYLAGIVRAVGEEKVLERG